MAGLTIEDYKNMDFDSAQLYQIAKGFESGVDVTIFAKKEFDDAQMQEIREGLSSGVDVSIYADTKFVGEQMNEIRIGLEQGVEVEIYALEDYSADDMRSIRRGLLSKQHWSFHMSYPAVKTYFIAKKRGYAVTREMFRGCDYCDEDMNVCLDFFARGLDPRLGGKRVCCKEELADELERINICNELGIIRKEYNEDQIAEIVAGYKKKLPVEVYLSENYSVYRMRAIQFLLEKEKYVNILKYLHATQNIPELLNRHYSLAREKYWDDETFEFLNCLAYILEEDKTLLEKVFDRPLKAIKIIVLIMKKGFDVHEIIEDEPSSYVLDVLEKGCGVDINLYPFIKRGWTYPSMMNLVIMRRIGVDADEFISATDAFLQRKREEYIQKTREENKQKTEEDLEQEIFEFLFTYTPQNYDPPPLPSYFIMTELPQEYGLFEEYELTRQSIFDLLSTVEFQEYCEFYYDDEENPALNNWTDSWSYDFGLTFCCSDLVSFAECGVNLEGRVYKSVNADGNGILYCFRRDFARADYVVFFKEKRD